MPTVGRTTTSGNNLTRQNVGSNNQYGFRVTMPAAGLITTLHVLVAGDGAAITGKLVLWNSSGAVVGQSANVTFPAGSITVNDQTVVAAALVTPYVAAASEVLYIGFWRPAANTADFSYISSGGTFSPLTTSTQTNVSSPSTLAIASTTTGQMTAYADYVQGGLDYASGGSFSKYAMKRYDSGSSTWKRHPLKRWNSSNSTWEWLA